MVRVCAELTRKLYPPQQGVRPEDVVAKGDSTGGGTWPPQGRGFASLFHIADCVQVTARSLLTGPASAKSGATLKRLARGLWCGRC